MTRILQRKGSIIDSEVMRILVGRFALVDHKHKYDYTGEHGSLDGLAGDDHAQYHNDTRGDARYYRENEHINSSAGAGDAGKPVVLDAGGKIDASMFEDSDVDHGSLGGLAGDDHSQYHNDSRGDARYYRENEHINSSAGAGDAGKPIVLDAGGLIDASMLGGITPVGGIILWSGAIVDIPATWALCDGNNGTPNLQNSFVIGAGDTYAVDATGGATTKNLQHNHDPGTLASGTTSDLTSVDDAGVSQSSVPQAGHNHSSFTGSTANAGSTTQDILPPYYALAFIMRVS